MRGLSGYEGNYRQEIMAGKNYINMEEGMLLLMESDDIMILVINSVRYLNRLI